MSHTVEKLKTKRRILRGMTTSLINSTMILLEINSTDVDRLEVSLEQLKDKKERLKQLDEEILNLLDSRDVEEHLFSSEDFQEYLTGMIVKMECHLQRANAGEKMDTSISSANEVEYESLSRPPSYDEANDVEYKPLHKPPSDDDGKVKMSLVCGFHRKQCVISCGALVSFITVGVVLALYFTRFTGHSGECMPLAPGVPDSLNIYNVTSSELYFQWESPTFPNRSITGFRVSLVDQKDHEIKSVNTDKKKYSFSMLEPWTFYTIKVAAFTTSDPCFTGPLLGPNQTASSRTNVIAPSAPTYPRVKSATNTSIEVAWNPPNIPNGPIDGYVIRNLNETPSHEISTKDTSYLFQDLKPWGHYTFSIKAFNQFDGSALFGPEISFVAQAGGLPPSAPTNPKVTKVTNSSIDLSWEKPDSPHGPLNGYILNNLNKSPSPDVIALDTSYLFQDLAVYTNYSFSIRAFNDFQGTPLVGPAVTIGARTDGSPPPYSLGRLSVEQVFEDSALLVIPTGLFSNVNGPVMEYVLLVEHKEKEDMSWHQGYDTLDESGFLTWTQTQGTDQWYRTSPINWNYETDTKLCKVGDQGTKFCTVGLQKKCDTTIKYCNGPLKATSQYWVKLRAYTDFGWTETFPLPFKTLTPPSTGNMICKPSVLATTISVIIALMWRLWG